MGRHATVEEISQVIIHLTSQHSKMLTGQTICVDGGKSKTIRGQQTWRGMKNGN